jgi:predicted nucleotide-binding protein (sugar kinase/HSP70/actin superfamily)
VLLARPYHNDEGVNHEILLQLQRLGYPVLAQDSVPVDPEFTEKLFRDDLRDGVISDPMEIQDVWPTSYSENTSRKVWAAKVVARHPNLVGIELSSFKCGHDAPPYTVIERIVATSKTPFFTFRDLDENSPGGAIRIRMETIDYFLKREKEKLLAREPVTAGAKRLEDLFQLEALVSARGKPAAPACMPKGDTQEVPAETVSA